MFRKYYVTKLASTGGFLSKGNVTLLIGTDEDKVDEVIERLKDIKCGAKPTSCPAQLAKSLQEHAK